MNRYVLALFAGGVLLLTGCKPDAPAVATTPSAAETAAAAAAQNVAVVDAYMAAWNQHDADAAAGHFADDVSYLDASVGTPQQGRDAARDNVIKVFLTAAPDCKWQRNGEAIVSGDSVAFEWTFTGTNTGAWGPETPATGKVFTFNGVSVFHLKDGKIRYQADYYDALGFNRQMGWIP